MLQVVYVVFFLVIIFLSIILLWCKWDMCFQRLMKSSLTPLRNVSVLYKTGLKERV